jgi:hypothetical protein
MWGQHASLDTNKIYPVEMGTKLVLVRLMWAREESAQKEGEKRGKDVFADAAI